MTFQRPPSPVFVRTNLSRFRYTPHLPLHARHHPFPPRQIKPDQGIGEGKSEGADCDRNSRLGSAAGPAQHSSHCPAAAVVAHLGRRGNLRRHPLGFRPVSLLKYLGFVSVIGFMFAVYFIHSRNENASLVHSFVEILACACSLAIYTETFVPFPAS